jgi:hypothetical protein
VKQRSSWHVSALRHAAPLVFEWPLVAGMLLSLWRFPVMWSAVLRTPPSREDLRRWTALRHIALAVLDVLALVVSAACSPLVTPLC